MAYACDHDEPILRATAESHANQGLPGFLARLAVFARTLWDAVVSWGDRRDEAAIARFLHLRAGGKLTDGVERELLNRLMATNWSLRE